MKKRLLFFIGGIILLIYLIYNAALHMAPYAAVKPGRFIVEDHLADFPNGVTPMAQGIPGTILDITVQDTIQLRGWFLPAQVAAEEKPFGTIIVLHGIASCKEHMIGLAGYFTGQGYNAIIYDSRAHGKSGGQYCTFGFYEKADVSAYIDAAVARFGDIHPIGIYGNSMGGAIALQAMEIDKRIRLGMIESTFATLADVMYEYQKRFTLGIGIKSFAEKVLEDAGKLAGFDPQAVQPEAAARNIYQPVLLMHGTADVHIPVEHGERIFANLASTEKKWFPVENASHYNVWQVAGEAYNETFREFLANRRNFVSEE